MISGIRRACIIYNSFVSNGDYNHFFNPTNLEAANRRRHIEEELFETSIRMGAMNNIRLELRDDETPTTYCFAPLAELLRDLKFYSVTDQSDRVYALFGMAQSGDCSALEANYSESTEALSRRVSGHLAENGYPLELLYGLASLDNENLSS